MSAVAGVGVVLRAFVEGTLLILIRPCYKTPIFVTALDVKVAMVSAVVRNTIFISCWTELRITSLCIGARCAALEGKGLVVAGKTPEGRNPLST